MDPCLRCIGAVSFRPPKGSRSDARGDYASVLARFGRWDVARAAAAAHTLYPPTHARAQCY